MRKYILVIVSLITINLNAQFFPTLELSGIDQNAQIDQLDIEIDIVGNIAKTTVDMTFYNPNNRVMEGKLIFPLGENQEVVGFSLEVNGKLREASVVEKERARVAYEATIRVGIDPGLLEKHIDSYSARIFPIPSNGYKRVVLTIQEELNLSSTGYKYILPFKSGVSIPYFKLNSTIHTDIKPQSSGDFSFNNWENSYSLNVEKKDYKLGDTLTFTIPKQSKSIWVDDDYFYGTIDVSDLFVVKQNRMVPKPINITLFYDISSSIYSRDLDLEFNYLTAYLNGMNKNSIVEIVPFNISRLKSKTFKAGDADKVISFLINLKGDGGTRFTNLDFKSVESDRIILISDGVSTFEPPLIPSLPNTAIDTINTSFKSNSSLLKYLAIKTGGDYINLHNNNLISNSPKLIKVESDGVSEVYNDLELDQSSFSFVGKLTGDNGDIKFHFSKSDGTVVIKSIQIDSNSDDLDINIEKLWAIKKLNSLDLLYDLNKDQITKIGKKYNIVTRNTSLIVLDRIEDYVTYNITPPEELKKEWNRLVDDKEKSNNKFIQNSLSEALNEMNALKKWWLKDFPKNRPVNRPLEKISNSFASEEPRSEMSMSMLSADESDVMSEVQSKEIGGNSRSASSSISIKGWTPDVPYLKLLEGLKGTKLLNRYYEIKADYIDQPSFYVDVSTLFYDTGDRENALLILSNVVEMELEEPELLRITAYLLEKFGYYSEALIISKKLLDIRAEEPQTYRDIANLLLLNDRYQEALEYYYKVLLGDWDNRFNGIKSVVLNEMNYLISNFSSHLNLKNIDKRLIFDMPLGGRAIISWSSDNNDIDLWVLDPFEEDCGYSNPLTHTGGKLSSDFTGGYGPEEFSIKEPLYGEYKVDIKFFSDRRMSITGPVTIKVDIYVDNGDGLIKETIIRRLVDVNERMTIGTFNATGDN